MGRIIPSLNEINEFYGPLKEGEKKILTFLDNNLSYDWKIYFKPNINGNNPDLALFNPNKGLMLYNIREEDKDTIFEKVTPKVQLDQVKHYKKEIIKHLVPCIGETIDKSNDRTPYGTVKNGIYTHKISSKLAKHLFNYPDFPKIIGSDDLFEENLSNIIPGFLGKNKYMTEEWAEELEFWLNPPFHKRKQIKYIELEKKQKEHSEPKSGRHRLHGPAGCGKTLVIAHRAAQLAQEGKKVLIVTYNVTLWHYIKDMIDKTPYRFDWRNIIFDNFHGFCLDVLNELAVPKPSNDGNVEVYLDALVDSVNKAIEDPSIENINNLKFDAIMMDEGQDFKREWYELLCKFLTKRNEILVVCDEKQNIYNRKIDWMPGRWLELNTVFRLPKKIGDIVNKFSKEFELDSSVPIEGYAQSTLFEFAKMPQSHFIWENTQMNNWLLRIKAGYDKIKLEQSRIGDGDDSNIVILLPSASKGLEAVEFFKNIQIDVNHVFNNNGNEEYSRLKRAFWIKDKRLKMSTIHSFKGWEASNVIILIPDSWRDPKELDNIVYTAMTRTQENLMVFNTNKRYFDFGDRVKSKW